MALVKVAVSSFFDILRENFCEKATNTLRSGQVMTKHFEKPKNMIFFSNKNKNRKPDIKWKKNHYEKSQMKIG